MAYRFKEITVLIVDSQPAILELIKDVLKMFGVQRTLAYVDGKAGLKAFATHSPDILIVDWDLSNLDGLAFTKAIRESASPYTPIIFMTAFSSAKRVVAARDSGITEFLRKPFTAEALYKRIEEIIERPRPFVRAPEFFGPDRRRRPKKDFSGADRRSGRPAPAGGKPRKK